MAIGHAGKPFPLQETCMTTSQPFSDPSVDGPRFKFGLGVAGVASYYPSVPNLPGAPSTDWHIAQWHTPETMDPAAVILGDTSDPDPILGNAVYTWKTPHTGLALSTYGTPGDFSYRLSSSGGEYSTDGGKNIFIETNSFSGQQYTFDHPMSFTAKEAISQVLPGNGPEQVGNNFVVIFNGAGMAHYNPLTPTYSVFLQVPLSDSRGPPGEYASRSGNTLIYSVVGGASMGYAPASGMSNVSIDMNSALLKMIAGTAGILGAPTPQGYGDLSRWYLSGAYFGLETMDTGGLSLDVQHPVISSDLKTTYIAHGAPAVTIAGPSVPAPASRTDIDSVEQQVNLLYRAVLGRDADVGGLSNFSGAVLYGNMSLIDAARSMQASQEYSTVRAGLSNTAYMISEYQIMMGRTPAASELKQYTDALDGGATRANISASFAASIEAQVAGGTLAAATVNALYKTILGRDMDAGGGGDNIRALLAGVSPRDLAKGMLLSPERQSHAGGISNDDFVTGLYRDGIGRAPDAGGLENWSKSLSSGSGYSRDMLVGDFASSTEVLVHAGYGSSIHFT